MNANEINRCKERDTKNYNNIQRIPNFLFICTIFFGLWWVQSLVRWSKRTMTCSACDSSSVVRNGFNLYPFTLNSSPLFGSKITTAQCGKTVRTRKGPDQASPRRCKAVNCRVEFFIQGQNSFCVCIDHERTWSYSWLFLHSHMLYFVSPATQKFATFSVRQLCLN